MLNYWKRKLETKVEEIAHLNAAVVEMTPDNDADMERELLDAENGERKCGTLLKVPFLLQKIWVQGIEWDQLVSKEIQDEWEQMKDDLHSLSELKLQRCISPQGKIANVQLHLFTDASEMASTHG